MWSDHRELVVGALHPNMFVQFLHQQRAEFGDEGHDGIEAFLQMAVGEDQAAESIGIAPGLLMLLPLHVGLLELVIDPTCSIVLERQPAEKDIMDRPPRKPTDRLLSAGILGKSLLQGFALFAASFGTYLAFLGKTPDDASVARTMGLAIILLGNVLLVEVNSSTTKCFVRTFLDMIGDKVMWSVMLGSIAILMLMIYTPLHGFLKLSPLSFGQLALAVGIAAVAVLWYEAVKLWKRMTRSESRRTH